MVFQAKIEEDAAHQLVVKAQHLDVMDSLRDCLRKAQAANIKISGMFLVPIHVYMGSDTALKGQTCIVLGKERWGQYSGKLNFFGGKRDNGENPMQALLREVDEELCVRLSTSDLDQCVTTAVMSGTAILVFAHVKGLSRSQFKKQMGYRHKQPACRREMSDISHVPVSQLQKYAVSGFVSQEIHAIRSAVMKLNLQKSVHVGKKWC